MIGHLLGAYSRGSRCFETLLRSYAIKQIVCKDKKWLGNYSANRMYANLHYSDFFARPASVTWAGRPAIGGHMSPLPSPAVSLLEGGCQAVER